MNRFIIILGLLFSFLIGQEIPDKENEYLQLQSNKQIAEQQLDSLNQILEVTLKEIDEEKSKHRDEDKITELMSTALTKTKEIEKKEVQIKSLNGSIIKLEKELNIIYSKRMAILERELDNDISKEERNKFEQELFLLAEKRIRVVPLFQNFKFKAEKINAIDIAGINDELEREISLDYLRSALTQVDSNIKIITEKTKELEDTKQLEEKADLFMDDIAESQVMGFYESSTAEALAETDRNDAWLTYKDDNTEWAYAERNAIANTIDFLSQLEYMGMPSDDRINRYKLTSDYPITAEEYLEMLKSTHDFLNIYRNMLLNKISVE